MEWDSSVQLDDTSGEAFSWHFSDRIATIAAFSRSEVEKVLSEVETQAEAGRYAVGFVAYEAASAINPDLFSHPSQEGLPLAWFAVFKHRFKIERDIGGLRCYQNLLQLDTGIDAEHYRKDVSEIRERIAAGECYQANYTFSRTGDFPADPETLYQQIIATQKACYCARLDTGRFLILSASPELFFSRDGNRIITRPMKGTISRGKNCHEDAEQLKRLAIDPKELTENVMIVDLLRNDLGMVAENGSVVVNSLFEVETYPTLHQMTSTISAQLKPDTGLLQLFRALFPCGSVTGAPKRKTMEILTQLESSPRGVYCGAIGMIAPGGEAVFSVAIRTLVCDREKKSVRFGVGSGITWDSEPDSEYCECMAKGLFATTHLPISGLIESLRCENGTCLRLKRHLKRMAWSAGRIGINFNQDKAASFLMKYVADYEGLHKVKLLLLPDGSLSVISEPLVESTGLIRIAISGIPVDPDDMSLYLKLINRSRHEQARSEHPDADEVLMTNIKGELTEGTFNNLVLKLKDKLVTPPVSSGLLPGVMRELLLEEGVIGEQVIYPTHLHEADEIWLINSVRGWRKGTLIESSVL